MMTKQWKEVVRLHFHGERFSDHAIDLTALRELEHFQKMVAETAKAIWRKTNPGRERLPSNFEDRTRLCFRTIEDGSTVIPLEVSIEEPVQLDYLDQEPEIARELTEAVDVIYRVFRAVHDNTQLPEECPKELLPEYARWGESLSENEALGFAPRGNHPAQVAKPERQRLRELAEQPYEDEVNIIGRVLEADVRQRKFQIWLDERTNALVTFTEEQESEVTTALKEHQLVHLGVRGHGEFTPQGTLKRIITVDSLNLVRDEDPIFDSSAPRVEDVIAKIAKDVPDEEWDRLPPDLTDRLDHYLYGGEEE